MDFKNYSHNATLNDGSVVVVRATKPSDSQALLEAFSDLSQESTYSRFLGLKPCLSAQEVEYFTNVDFVTHVALTVDLLEDRQVRPIGIGRYIVSPSRETAEVAMTVEDDYQGIGVGSLLLKHLARIGRCRGLRAFHAALLPTNTKVVRVLRRSQLPMQESTKDGLTEITLSLNPGRSDI